MSRDADRVTAIMCGAALIGAALLAWAMWLAGG